MSGVTDDLRNALGDRYELQREIARGGAAVVYLARDVKHDRDVAVKVLNADSTLGIDTERFRREIELVARMQHPHIVALFDSGEVAGRHFYVMPLVTGESLRERIARSGQLPIDDVRRITSDIAEALEYAHRRGIVHRDMKPANVLLDDTHAMVADFGIARSAPAMDLERLTSTGTFVGTPAYMSPEQATGAAAVDARTDIYSLGCVVFEMLTGHPPYDAASAQGILGKHVTSLIPAVSARRPELPEQVDVVLQKALAKEPDARFGSVREFADSLEAALVAIDSPQRQLGIKQNVKGILSRRRSRLALGSGLLVLVVVVSWLSFKRQEAGASTLESLVVLPLDNLSGDSTQNYFVEGMHDALIGQLAQISGQRIISRTSAMRYAGTTKSLPEIAGELRVDAVLEGSVQRAGDSVRIQLQLIAARPERHIWTETYQRSLKDVISLYGEIASAVANQIATPLGGRPAEPSRRFAPVPERAAISPVIYDDYLRGRFYLAQAPAAGTLDSAIRYFDRAIKEDSTFALAHAGLALSYWWFSFSNAPEFYSRARVQARVAVELDPTLSEAHVASALARMTDWDWQGSEASFKEALRLNPSSSLARQWYAQLLRMTLRLDESMREARLAVELDPFELILQAMVGWVFFSQGRHEEALNAYQRVLDLDPEYGLALYNMGLSYWVQRRGDKVIEAAKQSKAAGRAIPEPIADWLLSIGYAVAGKPNDARRTLDDMIRKFGPAVPYCYRAAVHNELRDDETALKLLDTSLTLREPTLPLLTSEPIFVSLRQHPRFRAIRAAMHLP